MQTEQIALLKEIRDLLKTLVAQGQPTAQAAEAPTGGGGPGGDE